MNRYLKSIVSIFIIMIISGIIFAAVFYAGIRFIFVKKEIVLPDFTNKQLYNAQKEAQDLGCHLYIADLAYTMDKDAGIVISQRIKPGTVVAKSRSIPVNVSLGPEKAFLIDYTGHSYYEALNNLKMKGFSPGEITEVYSSYFLPGQVIAQHPSAGQEINKNTPVNLLVSMGKKNKRYILPDLIGRDFFEVQYILDSMNVYIDEIHYKEVKGFPEDIVVNQNPVSGTLVHEGDYISLYLNKRGITDYIRQKYLYEIIPVPPGIIDYKLELFKRKGKSSELIWEKKVKPGTHYHLIINGFKDDTYYLYINDRMFKKYTLR